MMIELTVKTLDSQNHKFSVPDDYNIEQLKEHIAETIHISAELQRCIYLGQVLRNDQSLSELDLNGKVIHVVQRLPPSSALSENSSTTNEPLNNHRFEAPSGAMYVGALTLPSDLFDAGGITVLPSRSAISSTHLAVARSMLRRVTTSLNQLDDANYITVNDGNDSTINPSAANASTSNVETSNGTDTNAFTEISNSQVNSAPLEYEDGNGIPPSNGSVGETMVTVEDEVINEATNSATQNEIPENNNSSSSNGRRRMNARTSTMATVLETLLSTQERFIPYLRLLCQHLEEDPTFDSNATNSLTQQQLQNLFNTVSETMHSISHAYHALSDLNCDFSQPPPRTLRCRPFVPQPHATIIRAPQRRTIIRSVPTVVTIPSRSGTSNTNSPASSLGVNVVAGNDAVSPPTENNITETSTVEVVFEDADTTNSITNTSTGRNINDASSYTVRSNNNSGSTYFIQSAPQQNLLPDGIEINSMEATIVPADMAAALTTGGNSALRSNVPSPRIQNMIETIMNHVRQTTENRSQRSNGNNDTSVPQNQNSDDNNTSASNSQGNQTNENESQRAQRNNQTNPTSNNSNLATRIRNNIEMEFGSMLPRNFDPFLPCNSQHAHRTRRQGNLRNSNVSGATAASSSDTSVNVDQRSSSTEQVIENNNGGQPPSLSNLLASIISPSVNIGNITIRRGEVQGLPNNATVENGATNQTNANSPRAHLHVGSIEIEIDPLLNTPEEGNFILLNENEPTNRNGRPRRTASRRTRRSLNSNSQFAQSSSVAVQDLLSYSPELSSSSDEEIERYKTRIDVQKKTKLSATTRYLNSLIQNNDSSVHDSSLPNFPMHSEGQEGYFFEFLNSVLNNSLILEIFNKKSRNTNVKDRVHPLLGNIRAFFDEKIDIDNQDENGLLNAVNILINNDLHRLESLQTTDSVKPGIDLISTLCKFNQVAVPKMIEFVKQSNESNDFVETASHSFRKILTMYAARFMFLFLHCLIGNDKTSSIKQVVGTVMIETMPNLPKNPTFQRWLQKDLVNLLIAFSQVCDPDHLPDNLRQYIVHKQPTPTSPMECTATSMVPTNSDHNDTSQSSQPMDVEENVRSSSSEASFKSANSESISGATNQSPNNRTSRPENHPACALPATVLPDVELNSEDWRHSLSTEWVPIVERDVQGLRRQGGQPPFSDAYLSGMPCKRRKIVASNKPLVDNSNQLFSENVINSAMGTIAANSLTEHVNKALENDTCLNDLVKEELKEHVRENIVQQTDFKAERFPDCRAAPTMTTSPKLLISDE